MKLCDMTFDESRIAEMSIMPEAEKIMQDLETVRLFDSLFISTAEIDVKTRVKDTKRLVKKMIHDHYESTCKIFASLNNTDVNKIKKWKRSEANKQLYEMFQDGDLITFFTSSEALAQAVELDTSPK